MKAQKRHAILGCKFNGSPGRWTSTYEKNFHGLGGYEPTWDLQIARQDDIISCLGMLALCHLGYKIPGDPGEWLNRGFDVVVDYFCGVWWEDNEDATESMDKSPGNEWLRWFNAFARGLLLGLLSERWDELAAVCAWVEPGLEAEPLLVDNSEIEPDLSLVYTSLAASLRTGTMPGLAKLEKELKTCDSLRPRLLFEAWEAARAGDQGSFDQAFIRSLEEFASDAVEWPTPIQWVATHQSVVGLAAMRLGLRLPSLPPELDARVMTRSSLGLE